MTRAEFVEALARTRLAGEWEYSFRRLRLGSGGRDFCPVTAVTYARTGRYFLPVDWREAAAALGLEQEAASDVTQAADWPQFWDRNDPVDLRLEMERACNLPPVNRWKDRPSRRLPKLGEKE